MHHNEHESTPTTLRIVVTTVLAIGVGVALALLVEDPIQRWGAAIAGVCLVLWLSETVPPFVPTLLLIPSVALALGLHDERFGLGSVLPWAADPVLALFLGGFVLSAAASRYRIDHAIAGRALGLARGRSAALLLLCAAATAILSMWISNIAAAAMMLAAMRPILSRLEPRDPLRMALLLGIAFAANIGGIATPIGTGPNAIAMAEVSDTHDVTFLSWMAFALPLTIALIGVVLAVITVRYGIGGRRELPAVERSSAEPGAGWVVAIFLATVVLWLSEPLHGIPAAVVALLSTALLFLSGLLGRHDLKRVDWSTLLLIAGGITLGRLLEETRIVHDVAGAVDWSVLSPFVRTLILCMASALISSLMSNTAGAALLIPLAATIDPSPALSILIAVAASLGTPFVISTPPNAMVYGEGGLRFGDLALPGLIIMFGGTLLISLTGRAVLGLLGIP